MNIAEASIKFRLVTYVITVLIIIGGIVFYDKLGRLEDPEFTIKEAQVITPYPGASPKQVETEVTEKIETAIQELGQLKRLKESLSKPGVSVVTPEIKDKYDKHALPQVWDELRRKVNDVQSKLPPGAGPSIVFDDYGDVFGVLIALSGEGFSYAELNEYAKFLRRELLLVPDVAKITFTGVQQEQIFVEISRSRLYQLGISLQEIYAILAKQNVITNAGSVRVGDEYIRIQPSGGIDSVKEIQNLVIRSKDTKQLIYLKDISDVKRGYINPPVKLVSMNGEPAIALGISTVAGGNVVTMGEAIAKRLDQLQSQLPLGLKFNYIYYQGEIVKQSVDSFMINLIQAILIVIAVLMIFMGLRSGLLIGAVLLITVCSTIIIMYSQGIMLQRISLGALIIALGMLVDNAIVVTEGILIRLEQGKKGLDAAKQVVAQNQWPLLGATVVAILAFAAIGLSQDNTGEFLRSLFQVMLISLGMSWLIAITITPLLCITFLKPGKVQKKGDKPVDPYAGKLFQSYKKFLKFCLHKRHFTVSVVLALLISAFYAFSTLEDSFFPDSTSPQFMLHLWLPQGTDIRTTNSKVKEIEKFLQKQADIVDVASFVGGGAPRFMLVYSPEKDNNAYAFLLIKATDWTKIPDLSKRIHEYLKKNNPSINERIEKIRLGPGGGFPIEVRFSGDDPNVLRELSNKAKEIMRADGGAMGIRDNWRERVKVITPEYAAVEARRAGVTRRDIAKAIEMNLTGLKVGIYRESDELIPIISRPPADEREDVNNLYDILLWSPVTNTPIPLRQVVSDFKTTHEDSIIYRRNKRPTITTQSEPIKGNASVVLERIMPKINAIPLPIGYIREWGGEYENSKDAQAGLQASLPMTMILMVLITIMLFNGLRQPLIIWLTVPLATIGVAYGLLATNEPFGFMALLGFLSLVGMLIKNAIVLIDEIDTQIASNKPRYDAIVDSAVSRLRPVTMAAITTILGMIPLLSDVFFFGMAVTIMSGLAFATLLTLIIVPVFYSLFFRITDKETA